MKTSRLVAIALFLVVAGAAPAWGHAERVGSTPEEGATVAKPPKQIVIDFAEPPTANPPKFKVTDGCGKDVTGDLTVENQTITAAVNGGSPGTWTVSSTVISGLDGHESADSFQFKVAGKKDCGGGEKPPKQRTPAPPGGGDGGGDGGDDGGGSTGLILIIGAATIVVVAIALVIRRSLTS